MRDGCSTEVKSVWRASVSDKPHDRTLERINRLLTAVADLMESQVSNDRGMLGIPKRLDERLDSADSRLAPLSRDVRELASGQMPLGNRVETAFARALWTHIRLDDIEDRQRAGA